MSIVHARRGAVLLLLPALVLVVGSVPATGADVSPQQAAPPEFAGMKHVPAGEFGMGLDEKALVKLYGDPNKNPTRKHHKVLTEEEKLEWWNFLRYETPEHRVSTREYALDVYPVTNAQYLQFLEESAKSSFFTRTKVNTFELVAKALFGDLIDDAWKVESLFWINEKKLLVRWEEIRKANAPRIEAILKEFNMFRPQKAWITDFLKLPDKQRAEGWVQFLLPENIALTVYTRPIPDHWLKPPEEKPGEKKDPEKYVPREMLTKEMESWPVVFVTAEDADAFAEWSGKHLPTEAEWEKGGRGPRNWLYPWGKDWDWKKDRNKLVWRDADPEPKGPAAPFKDHPVDVTRCAESASPHGMMHMLGNVREWTSSVPTLYPGSKALAGPWNNSPLFRVIRSTSYGDGLTSDGPKKPNLELMHRLTTRALEFQVAQRFQAVGFRCAKYYEASRDVLGLRYRAMYAAGSLKKEHAEHYDPELAFGIEKNEYDPSGGGNHTYVKGHTTVLGVVPVDKTPYAQAKDLIAASMEKDPTKGGPVMFAWIYWNGDLKVEVVKEEIVEQEAPPEEGAPAEEGGEKKDAPDGEKKDAPKKKDKKKRPGKDAPKEEPEEPVGPKILQTRHFVSGHRDHPYFLGIVDGRLAMFEWKARGPELMGYLPVQTTAGQAAEAPAVMKAKAKTLSDVASASIDTAKGFVRIRITSKTRSETSPDVFVYDVVLKVQGSLDGTWRGYSSK